jgi:hypothetical protein
MTAEYIHRDELAAILAQLMERLDLMDAQITARLDHIDAQITTQMHYIDANQGGLRSDLVALRSDMTSLQATQSAMRADSTATQTSSDARSDEHPYFPPRFSSLGDRMRSTRNQSPRR